MKKGLIFFAGVATGFLGVIVLGTFSLTLNFSDDKITLLETEREYIDDNSFEVTEVVEVVTDDNTITRLETEGEYINYDSFEVDEVLENGNAITHATKNYGLKVLFLAEKGKLYYDNQIINIPNGKCVKQIGIYKHYYHTIPVVEITDK